MKGALWGVQQYIGRKCPAEGAGLYRYKRGLPGGTLHNIHIEGACRGTLLRCGRGLQGNTTIYKYGGGLQGNAALYRYEGIQHYIHMDGACRGMQYYIGMEGPQGGTPLYRYERG